MRRRLRSKALRWTVIVLGLLVILGAATGGGAKEPSQSASHAAAKSKPNARSVGGLRVSAASNHVVQTQPAPGTCHARGSGKFSEPDPKCTPGALNPAVTQQTIHRTICVSGWTETVRPPESVTEREKARSMAAYGDSGSMHAYEYDHLVSLELGGATNDARNLWPEPGASPNPKDSVENALHRQVCDGQMSLAHAQHVIATDWIGWARGNGVSSTTPATELSWFSRGWRRSEVVAVRRLRREGLLEARLEGRRPRG
jgi:hypothetical protein